MLAKAEARGKLIEIWFADEARVGQKNTITRRWAKRGTRPAAPKDQRAASAYIFGAICPALGKGDGLVMPRCITEAMALHLEEIAQVVAPVRTPSCCSIRRAGAQPRNSSCPPTSPYCPCRLAPPTEPHGEPLAVHARQLARQPRLQILR